MSGINFLSKNLFDTASIVVDTGVENAQFPVLNLFNESTAKKMRIDSTTAILIIDLQSSTDIDSVAVHGDTNENLGIITASYRFSINTDFTSSPVINIPLSAADRLGIDILATPVVCRFIELTLTGSSFVELSNLFIGERDFLPFQNITKTTFKLTYLDKSISSENDYGQIFINKRNQIKMLSGSIDFLTPDEYDVIDAILIRHGTSSPLWIIVDSGSAIIDDGLDRLSIYGYLQKNAEWDKQSGLLWSTSVQLVQAG